MTDLDEATFRAIHLTPYEDAIAAGVRVVMASFSSTGAGKVHGDHHLLTEVLKGELGFTGFIVSDWGAVDQVDPDYDTAVATAISAGIDMVMVPFDAARFQAAVRTGLAAGTIDGTRVDDAVARILRVKFELGLFETPIPPGRAADLGSAADRDLARSAAAASAVVLKTTAGVLPVAADSGRVLLAGSGADDIGLQSGGWTIEWQVSAGPITPGTTIAGALSARLGDRVTVNPAGDFPAGTRARTGIAVLAEPPYAEGLGDSGTLALPRADVAIVGKVRPLVDRLVVVILSGRPVMLDRILVRCRCGDRRLAARDRGNWHRGRAARGRGVQGHDAVHVAAGARRRTPDWQGRMRRRGLPERLRPRRERHVARSGSLRDALTRRSASRVSRSPTRAPRRRKHDPVANGRSARRLARW